jgi:hypothetical protein
MGFPLHQQKISVTVQFILHEFLQVLSSLRALETITLKLISKKGEGRAKDWNSFRDCLYELTGSEEDYQPGLPWMVLEGSLHRLYNYCYAFASKRGKHHDEAEELKDQVERSLKQALYLRELLPCSPGSRCVVEPECGAKVLKNAETLIRSLHKSSRFLCKKLHDFSHEEDVLFYLLQHRVLFDLLFPETTLSTLFLKMYPKGLEQVEQFLIRQYTKRGFDELIPKINREFANI